MKGLNRDNWVYFREVGQNVSGINGVVDSASDSKLRNDVVELIFWPCFCYRFSLMNHWVSKIAVWEYDSYSSKQ